MLIVISIMFLVFNIPSDIYFLGYAYGAFLKDTAERRAVNLLFWAVINILYCTNNSLNFFMYFASGQKFRLAFLNTFFCVQPKKPDTPKTSSRTAMTGVQNTSMTTMTQQWRSSRWYHNASSKWNPATGPVCTQWPLVRYSWRTAKCTLVPSRRPHSIPMSMPDIPFRWIITGLFYGIYTHTFCHNVVRAQWRLKELCVIVANTKEMQKYIQLTPNRSVFSSSSLFHAANYIYSVSPRNCVNLSHKLNLVILLTVYVLFKQLNIQTWWLSHSLSVC